MNFIAWGVKQMKMLTRVTKPKVKSEFMSVAARNRVKVKNI